MLPFSHTLKSDATTAIGAARATTNGTIDPLLLQCVSTRDEGDRNAHWAAPHLSYLSECGTVDRLGPGSSPSVPCGMPAIQHPPSSHLSGEKLTRREKLGQAVKDHATAVTEHPNPLGQVRSHEDIPKVFSQILRQFSPENDNPFYFDKAVNELWESSTKYARLICKDISWLDRRLGFSHTWHKEVVATPGWNLYSTGAIGSFGPGCSTKRYQPGYFKEKDLASRLTELRETSAAIDTLRNDCIIQHWLDPSEPAPENSFALQETSDSCDADDLDNLLYREMRDTLTKFSENVEIKYLETRPIFNRRLRKDVRAYARLLSYSCVRLPCNSMFIHKDPWQLPVRRRKKRIPDYQDLTAQQTDSRILDPLPVTKYNYYSSSGTGNSGTSVFTTASGSKKRRLPKDEGGYACSFSGCEKVYDRQCDLSHHQRSHRPKDELPFPCESCGKRLPYAKDLRRHEKSCLMKCASD